LYVSRRRVQILALQNKVIFDFYMQLLEACTQKIIIVQNLMKGTAGVFGG